MPLVTFQKRDSRASKHVIVPMKAAYPFGDCDEDDLTSTKVLVRRQILLRESRATLSEQVRLFRRLDHPCIIKIEQVLQEQQSMHLMYEYVPIRLQAWISNINEQFIMTFRQQMLEFTNYLARCFIVSEIRFGNIGMDDHYKPKYFLDLNIHISEACDKDSLRDYYHGIIDTIFMPFIHKNRSPHKAKPYQLVPCNTSTMHVRETDSEPTVKKYSVGNMQIPSAKQKLINLNNRIDDIKSRIRNFDSEDSSSRKKLDTADACKVREITMLKRPSVIQFGMTEKSKQLLRPGTEPRGKQFYSNVFKSMQEDTPFFDILANPFKARPNRKNESLKEKEYLQMVRSKDGYFKDFFKVLEDQPSDIKALMPNILREKVKEPPAILQRNKELDAGNRTDRDKEQQKVKYGDKKYSEAQQLEQRVKQAILRTKNLISKFKKEH